MNVLAFATHREPCSRGSVAWQLLRTGPLRFPRPDDPKLVSAAGGRASPSRFTFRPIARCARLDALRRSIGGRSSSRPSHSKAGGARVPRSPRLLPSLTVLA